MNQNFCPNCGQALETGATFCPNCGTKITNDTVQAQAPAVEKQKQVVQPSQPKAPRKPMSKKTKVWLIVAAAAVIVIAAFVGIGNAVYSKDRQVAQIAATLTDKKGDVVPIIKAGDDTVKVDKNNTQGTHNYFVNLDNKTAVENSLKNTGYYGDYRLVQDGHNLLFFPKYKLEVPVYKVTVTTNHPDSVIYLDGKKVGKVNKVSSEEYRCSLGKVLRGTYKAEVRTNLHGKTLTGSTKINANGDGNVNMDIRTGTFKVKGVPDADVYINDEKVGTLNSKGTKTFKDYVLTNDMTLYIKANINGKEYKSEIEHNVDEQVADSDDVVIKPEFAGLISEDDAESLLEGVLSTDDPNEDAFIGGNDSRAYHLIADALQKISDRDDFIGISKTEVKILNINLAGKNESKVDFQVSYEFDFDDSTNKQTIEWDGCVIQKQKDGDPTYKIKSLGKSKMIKNTSEND